MITDKDNTKLVSSTPKKANLYELIIYAIGLKTDMSCHTCGREAME